MRTSRKLRMKSHLPGPKQFSIKNLAWPSLLLSNPKSLTSVISTFRSSGRQRELWWEIRHDLGSNLVTVKYLWLILILKEYDIALVNEIFDEYIFALSEHKNPDKKGFAKIRRTWFFDLAARIFKCKKNDFLNFHLILQTFDSLNSSYERKGFESSGMKYIAHIFTFNELKNDVWKASMTIQTKF